MQQIDLKAQVSTVGPALYRYFCASFSPIEADDLVQETFLRLLSNQNKFDPQLGSLRMFTFGIAHFVRLEHLRKKKSAPELPEIFTPDFEKQSEITRLRKAIQNLSEIQQQVLGFYLDKDLSQEEMATILQLPVNTIKSHLFRAKEALKEALK